jgi:hypothetical protein
VIRVRFLLDPEGTVQVDMELPAVPVEGQRVDLGPLYATPCWTVDEVWWTPHDVIPADVCIFLDPYEEPA